MFGFQTLACLHNIPVVRSSTNKLQDAYTKAKDKSVLIRLPCSVAEILADKSLKIAVTVANPFVKPLRGPVRIIDDFAVEKLRQMEAKYPVINTSTEKVISTLNEKTEPVRNALNTVKDATTSTIQHGKDTVSNVANATVNKATNVADSVYTFCETHVPGKTAPTYRYDFGRRTTLLWERMTSTIGLPITSLLTWFRVLIVSFLLRIKQTNDAVLNQTQQQPVLFVLPQRLLIYTGSILDYLILRVRPNEPTERKQQTRSVQQKQFVSRQTYKPGEFLSTRQSVVVTKQDTVITRNGFIQSQIPTSLPVDYISTSPPGNDIEKLHAQLQPTDVELLYTRLPADVLSTGDSQDVFTEDQQLLHASLIAAELAREDYLEDEDDSYEQ